MSKEKFITKGNSVRNNTPPSVNKEIDEEILKNIKYYSDLSEQEITERIKKLDEEWDIEHLLEVKMSALAITGIILSACGNRKWLTLPAAVLGFSAQHAFQGWCPPVKLLRSLKVRTRNELDQEKHALKALRGDYDNLQSPESAFKAAQKEEY